MGNFHFCLRLAILGGRYCEYKSVYLRKVASSNHGAVISIGCSMTAFKKFLRDTVHKQFRT
jgi:hypothetical protein